MSNQGWNKDDKKDQSKTGQSSPQAGQGARNDASKTQQSGGMKNEPANRNEQGSQQPRKAV
jgi:hypothetical protein